MLCREQIAQLREHIPGFEAQGARVLILGNGFPGQAQVFRDEFDLGERLVTDPDLDCYRALETSRGLRSTFDFRMIPAVFRAFKAGFRQSGVQGDAMQLGGVFLLLPNGTLPWAYAARFAGDHPEPEEIARQLERHLVSAPARE